MGNFSSKRKIKAKSSKDLQVKELPEDQNKDTTTSQPLSFTPTAKWGKAAGKMAILDRLQPKKLSVGDFDLKKKSPKEQDEENKNQSKATPTELATFYFDELFALCDGTNRDVIFTLALLRKQENKFEMACNLLRKVLALDPDYVPAHAELAQCLLLLYPHLDHAQEEIIHCLEAVQRLSFPERASFDEMYLLAQMYITNGNFGRAIELLEEQKRHGTKEQCDLLAFDLAHAYFASNQFEQARQVLELRDTQHPALLHGDVASILEVIQLIQA